MTTIFRAGLFSGEVALVTGGGTGIGFATASELGAKVALCGRRPEPLAKAAGELTRLGVEVFTTSCDIRDPEQVEAVKQKFGRIDVLVNNAGGQKVRKIEAGTPGVGLCGRMREGGHLGVEHPRPAPGGGLRLRDECSCVTKSTKNEPPTEGAAPCWPRRGSKWNSRRVA